MHDSPDFQNISGAAHSAGVEHPTHIARQVWDQLLLPSPLAVEAGESIARRLERLLRSLRTAMDLQPEAQAWVFQYQVQLDPRRHPERYALRAMRIETEGEEHILVDVLARPA